MYKKIFITGGAGYVGSTLVPELVKEYMVSVYDLYLYNFTFNDHPNLTQIVGDIRDRGKLIECSDGADIIIHLASTGAPTMEIGASESINYKATKNVIDACKINGVKRLIIASSTSQYGIKPLTMSVTEDVHAEPVDHYGKYKIMSEELILNSDLGDTEFVFVRPSTLCGYSSRLRLDLAVNTLTINALITGKIKIFGGEQMRPTLNIKDMIRFYKLVISAHKEDIHRQAFNVLYENKTIFELAEMVKKVVGNAVDFDVLPSDDKRSYHVNADKAKNVLGFECTYDLEEAVGTLVDAYHDGLIVDGLNNPIYYNAKIMKRLE